MKRTIYLLLGSNEGDRLQQLRSASGMIGEKLAIGQTLSSAVYETAAWGLEDQPSFLNMALQLDTEHTPEDVLRTVQEVEQYFGRQRKVIWGQRTLDVDILFYGDMIIDTPDLVVPHPQLPQRRFALTPLAELAPGLVHPAVGLTVAEMLRRCKDSLPVRIYELPTPR